MKILHFIDNLDFGGAETLLMSYIPLLNQDEHIVVTLTGPNAYERTNYEYIELNAKPLKGFFNAVAGLRKIIRQRKVDIVHSHSYWTHIISRLATRGKIKLINHYHFADYDTMKDKPAVKKMILLDRMTNRRSLVRVAVSEYVARILKTTFPKGNIKVIPNFINCKQQDANRHGESRGLRVIAVGSCNLEKNYGLVLDAFADLRNDPITLDIVGGGDRLDHYRAEASRLELNNVRFCGIVSNARELLKDYDLFLSASISETFGIAVLEAVCAKLPLLLSDIPAFHEISPPGSHFFNPHDKRDLVNQLRDFRSQRAGVNDTDYDRVLNKYSKQAYLSRLNNLYNN